jgi:hypothetical protein
MAETLACLGTDGLSQLLQPLSVSYLRKQLRLLHVGRNFLRQKCYQMDAQNFVTDLTVLLGRE